MRAASDVVLHPQSFAPSDRLTELAMELRVRAALLERAADEHGYDPGLLGEGAAYLLREIGEVRS